MRDIGARARRENLAADSPGMTPVAGKRMPDRSPGVFPVCIRGLPLGCTPKEGENGCCSRVGEGWEKPALSRVPGVGNTLRLPCVWGCYVFPAYWAILSSAMSGTPYGCDDRVTVSTVKLSAEWEEDNLAAPKWPLA